jgi:CheY-like chemotaxis protein/HPt (histidine-containing phosphotransfer) domain-containing protein
LRFATQEGKGPATVETTNSSNRALPVRGHVLVVEDDAVNAAVAQGYLEALGCTSVWVPSGSRALEQFSLESFDLVLMDLNMPDMDGFETTRRLRETAGESRRIPIVALTAHDRARFGAACIEAGIDDILTKPYTFDGCGAMLRRWLGPLADSAAAAPAVDDAAPRVEAARPPESAVDADLALVDESIVERLKSVQAKGAVSLYARLCDLFCSGSPIEIDKLGVAVALADFPAASAICHRLKSSSGNLGARAFSRAVAELEQICVDEDGPRAQELFARICAAHPALLAALSRNDVRAIA